ncbi:DoxX family protein [Mycolicibacterium lacusdiani]|uniref:DoxX family protein n=1 Tax=Mycolicibacterium lacusdiani TaxID=2895283 RepID=UPI001F3AFA3C|nr:hypothetical protein [Mycolicibacterium lacusdiani]
MRTLARLLLGAALVFAGVSHLTFARASFYAQVPPYLPLNVDFVVIVSGIVEIALGLGLLFVARWRVALGWLTAALFVAVFPGNVSQYLTHSDAFGLDSDRSRAIRLAFQPLLVVWALWATGAWAAWRARRATDAGRPAAS